MFHCPRLTLGGNQKAQVPGPGPSDSDSGGPGQDQGSAVVTIISGGSATEGAQATLRAPLL